MGRRIPYPIKYEKISKLWRRLFVVVVRFVATEFG
jgi:hypothetical protein